MIPIIQFILAIGLPAFAIWKSSRTRGVRYPYLYSLGSFACCAWGIISELTTIRSRLLAEDIGGISDTIDAVIIISIIMTVAAIIINAISLGITSSNE